MYGINILRFSRDGKARGRAAAMLAVYGVLAVFMMLYVGGFAYGLVWLGQETVIPAYLTAISSLLIFFLGIFKAGSVLFGRNGYEILCSLPVSHPAVVSARFVRMYVENLLATLAVLLPGTVVYSMAVRPGLSFYGALFLGIWAVPLLPMAGAVLVGALVMGISSRIRYRNLVEAGLTILAALAVLYGVFRLSAATEVAGAEFWRELSGMIFAMLEKVYPPALWLGMAMVRENWVESLGYSGFSLAVFALVAAGVILFYHRISQGLSGSTARHDYEMGELKARSVMGTLCRREFRRYFASSVYVSNTIMGPVMSCLLSGILLLTGTENITGALPFPVDLCSLAPFALGGILCMMPPAATSISMEGKNWWIIKSLPLPAKSVLDAKLLMNLLLFLPFYLLSEVLLLLAFRPDGMELVWLVLIPAVILVFSCVYGLAVNLHFPVMDWESEVSVVKQSVSSLLGGLGCFVLSMLCAGVILAAPQEYGNVLKGVFCGVALLGTAALYGRNCRKLFGFQW